jgi:hypothetical protein
MEFMNVKGILRSLALLLPIVGTSALATGQDASLSDPSGCVGECTASGLTTYESDILSGYYGYCRLASGVLSSFVISDTELFITPVLPNLPANVGYYISSMGGTTGVSSGGYAYNYAPGMQNDYAAIGSSADCNLNTSGNYDEEGMTIFFREAYSSASLL